MICDKINLFDKYYIFDLFGFIMFNLFIETIIYYKIINIIMIILINK
uniref:Uncharacterized protein n=1 Tax=viral metagenome TaxID=1070528 RepID=A0A6C0LQT5_9ZZZZ